VYVDANPACNTLLFQMGPTAVGTTLATRQWTIKVAKNYLFYRVSEASGKVYYFCVAYVLCMDVCL